MGGRSFDFAFEPRFVKPLSLIGVTPSTARVVVDAGVLDARFGPWRVRTGLDNITGAEITGPYRWYRAIGPRLSLSDRGLTFGTNTRTGLCLSFREPVPGLDPLGVLRHSGLTLTVADTSALAEAVLKP